MEQTEKRMAGSYEILQAIPRDKLPEWAKKGLEICKEKEKAGREGR